MPGIWASPATSSGRPSASATSVASVNTTYAGTLAAVATADRQVRRASKVVSSYVGGQSSQRPTLRSLPVMSGDPQVRHLAGVRERLPRLEPLRPDDDPAPRDDASSAGRSPS